MFDTRIVKVEWAGLPGTRPREAGSNSRLDVHGLATVARLMRITTADGHTGLGWSNCPRSFGGSLLGKSLGDVFVEGVGPADQWRPMEYPLWDLAARLAGKPVFRLLADQRGVSLPEQVSVPCYDTSLYIDDLHLSDDDEAVELLKSEAAFGKDQGHTNFKIKVGRGGRHMPLEAGTVRDIKVIKGVREVAGPDGRIMIDANNGWNLNLAKRILSETADARVHWIEEAFHEDSVLYEDLQEWKRREGIDTLIADGEGQASPTLMDMAAQGLVDVVQYDIFSPGLMAWLDIGGRLDPMGVTSSPHHYGQVLGNYLTGHLGAVLEHFGFVEWDAADTPGLYAPYTVKGGWISLPETPGFGLEVDAAHFESMVRQHGWSATLS